MCLDVRANGIERRERSRAFGTSKRLRVTVLVTSQLHSCFERLRTIWTHVSAFFAMCQQMMIVDGRRLETFATVLASIRPHTGMRTHMQGQAIGHAKSLPANLSTDTDIIIFFFFYRLTQSAINEKKTLKNSQIDLCDFVTHVHY